VSQQAKFAVCFLDFGVRSSLGDVQDLVKGGRIAAADALNRGLLFRRVLARLVALVMLTAASAVAVGGSTGC